MKKKEKKLISFLAAALSVCMTFSLTAPSLGMLTAFADENDVELSETISDSDGEIITEEKQVQDSDAAVPDAEENNSDADNDSSAPSLEEGGIAGQFNEDNRVVTNPARNIKLKVSQKNDIVIGEQFRIKYSFSPLKSDDFVTYRSFNKKIVNVDENGLVTAVGYGSTKVQLETSKGLKKNVYFNVTNDDGSTEAVQGEAEAIEFTDQSVMLRKGRTVRIEPIIYPLGIYDALTYSSGNEKVASVSSSGLVTAVGTGSTVITVTASNGVFGEFSITVYNDTFRGIDVSKWQGDINWKSVYSSGIDFVMIRSSFGSEDRDICLEKNVAGCEKYGIDYGFYHYTYAKTVSQAKKEAKYFLKQIRNYDPTYPVVLDIEEEFYKKMDRKKVTDIIVAFMEELEKAGYYASVYSYAKFFNDNVDMSRIAKYDIWVASWGDEEKLNNVYDEHYGMWQYSSTGSVKGIDGDVDLNYAYKDYAELIKKNGLNGQ